MSSIPCDHGGIPPAATVDFRFGATLEAACNLREFSRTPLAAAP
jgi:hypothetical protein